MNGLDLLDLALCIGAGLAVAVALALFVAWIESVLGGRDE